MISTGGIFNKKEVSRNTNGKLKKKFTKYFYIYIHIFAQDINLKIKTRKLKDFLQYSYL